VLSALVLATVLSLPVPYVPQEKDTCGAAALAMVLRYWGREASEAEIAGELVERELQGIRGSRLAELARERGMVAIAFAGEWSVVRGHLAKGRPVVVAIDAGHGRLHEVVVVGLDDQSRQAIVHDPARGPNRRIAVAELERKWAASGRWSLLVTPDVIPRDSGATGPEESAVTADPSAPVASEAPRHDRADGYPALVAGAVEAGRAGRYGEAGATLERAIAQQPRRPEAWTERGGVRFLEGRYDHAAADLGRSLQLCEDAYARDLLGSSLLLGGREREALDAWNPLGRPTLGAVGISGLEKTDDRVARREIGLAGASCSPPRGCGPPGAAWRRRASSSGSRCGPSRGATARPTSMSPSTSATASPTGRSTSSSPPA